VIEKYPETVRFILQHASDLPATLASPPNPVTENGAFAEAGFADVDNLLCTQAGRERAGSNETQTSCLNPPTKN